MPESLSLLKTEVNYKPLQVGEKKKSDSDLSGHCYCKKVLTWCVKKCRVVRQAGVVTDRKIASSIRQARGSNPEYNRKIPFLRMSLKSVKVLEKRNDRTFMGNDRNSRFIRNVSKFLPDWTLSYFRSTLYIVATVRTLNMTGDSWLPKNKLFMTESKFYVPNRADDIVPFYFVTYISSPSQSLSSSSLSSSQCFNLNNRQPII